MIKRSAKFLFLVLIIAVGLAVYSNSLRNEFIWDDELLVINNEQIKHLNNIPGLFTKHIAYGADNQSNSYRPLQMLSYALNYAVGRLDVRIYHLTNIGLHILVALALYWLTCLVSKNETLSLLAALLFVSHPIHTAAVTYISGRADPLAALFILLCAIFYLKSSPGQRLFYYLSLGSFLLALLSKEIAIITPLLLLADEYIYRPRSKPSLSGLWPFFLLGLIYIVLRKTILDFPVERTIINQFTFWQRAPVIFKSLTMYFEKLLLPLNLHMEYEIVAARLSDIQVISGIIVAVTLILVSIHYRRREKLVSFFCLWFLINYLPVSNIYPLNAFFAEHWIYTPSAGLFILLGWLAMKITQKGKLFKQVTYLALLLLLADNFYLTMRQNQYWANAEQFYQRTLKYAPHSRRVYYRLGLFYLRQRELDKAIKNLQRSWALSPSYALAYENLAAAYLLKGEYEQTIDLAQQALKIDAHSDVLHNSLGVAYAGKGWDEQALSEFRQAVLLGPDNAAAHCNLGNTYALQGEKEEAIAAFKKAIELRPNYALAHYNLARVYYDNGQYDLAMQHCDRARQLGVQVEEEFLRALQRYGKGD